LYEKRRPASGQPKFQDREKIRCRASQWRVPQGRDSTEMRNIGEVR
jgi:hypothetical protein